MNERENSVDEKYTFKVAGEEVWMSMQEAKDKDDPEGTVKIEISATLLEELMDIADFESVEVRVQQ